VKMRAKVLAVCVLALMTLLAGAAPAYAGPAGETACTGTLANAMVKGDLVVPAEQSCELLNTSVGGGVRLEYGARLKAEYAEIKGNVWIGEQADADLSDTVVRGSVEIRGTWALLDMFGGAIGGDVTVEDAERLNLSGMVGGDVLVARSRLFTSTNARVKGSVTVRDIEFAAVRWSHIGGAVTVERAREEARLCESSVRGDATFVGNATKVAIGGGAYLCGGNEVRGDLAVHQNLGAITIANNEVRGDLACTGNEPAPMGGGNQVEGNKEGQCSGL
jgi:hypothetical protein